MCVDAGGAVPEQIDVGIVATVALAVASDFQIDGHLCTSIDKMVAVRVILRERSAIICDQWLVAGVSDQHQLAGQHVNEFILIGMPVSLA